MTNAMNKLIEMEEQLKISISKSEELKEQHTYLLRVLESGCEKDYIKELYDNFEKDLNSLEEKKKEMEVRLNILNEILGIYYSGLLDGCDDASKAGSKFVEDIINKVFVVIGLEPAIEKNESQQ